MSTDCKQNIRAAISKEQKDFLQLIIHEDAATSLSGAVQWCIDACMRIEKLYGVDACYVSFNDIRKDQHNVVDTNQPALTEPKKIERDRFLTDFDNWMRSSSFKQMAQRLIKEVCEKYGLCELAAPSTNNQIEGEKVLRWVLFHERKPKKAGYYHVSFPEREGGFWFFNLNDHRYNWSLHEGIKWLEEADAPSAQPTDTPNLPINQVWDLSGIPDDQKHGFVDGMVKITAENFLKVFVMLGLKDGIESGVVNKATGDQFILIFKKLKYPSAQPAGISMDFSNGPDTTAYLKYQNGFITPITKEEFDAARPTETPSLPVEEGLKMSDELGAKADIAAIEYGETNGQSVCREEIDYDNSADLTDAFLAGQSWMYREMQKELSSLRTRLSEAQRNYKDCQRGLEEARNDVAVFKEWWGRAENNIEILTNQLNAKI